VYVWDTLAGTVVQSFDAQPYKIIGIAFSDKDTLLTQGNGGKFADIVKVWNARTGKLLRSFEVPANWAGTAFSHDGKLLALTVAGDPNILQVWDTDTGKQLYTEKEHYPGLFFSHDGRHVIASRQHRLAHGKYDTIVTFREARTGKVQRTLELKDTQAAISDLTPDGKHLIGHTFIANEDQAKWRTRLQLFDAETGKVVRTLIEQRSGDLKSALFSPDGRFVTGVNHNERGLSVWDRKTGERKWEFPTTGASSTIRALPGTARCSST
jgi:WD40 repeat protein